MLQSAVSLANAHTQDLCYNTDMRLTRQRIFITAFNVATLLLMAAYVVEFVTKSRIVVPDAVAEVFLLVLVFYAGDKELHRWHHKDSGPNRRGELFVLIWVVLGVTMYILESMGGGTLGFTVPHDLGMVIWSVIIIFVITEYLKSEFHRSR